MERVFGVLKSRFVIICDPSHVWNMDTMKDIILACIILNNMIVEDEQDIFNNNVNVGYNHVNNDISNVEVFRDVLHDLATYLQTRRIMYTREIHQQLQVDLVEYINVTIITIMKFNFSLTLMCCIFLLSNLCIFHLFNI